MHLYTIKIFSYTMSINLYMMKIPFVYQIYLISMRCVQNVSKLLREAIFLIIPTTIPVSRSIPKLYQRFPPTSHDTTTGCPNIKNKTMFHAQKKQRREISCSSFTVFSLFPEPV